MIRCVDVHKSYRTGGREVHALRGCDLTIDEPGFYAVMGASGSGKSTLLHLLAALDSPDSGEIHVGGRRLDTMSERELTMVRRDALGIVFQQFNLLPTMTALENVTLPGLLAGKDARTMRERGMHLLERLGLADRATHRPEALSGGEQQRVAIARALLFAPPVLFADEPTGNLDAKSSEHLWGVLADVAQQQDTTVLMVTHEPAAASHCRRAYILSDGVVTGTLETEGLDAGGIASRYQQLVGSA
ncbi:MAG: ABC transporter ATP-binding protein [Phycisphaerales bacterium]